MDIALHLAPAALTTCIASKAPHQYAGNMRDAKFMAACPGDMLGLGALALPSVFARLGWLPATVLLAVCALGALYSGRLFTIMAQQVCCLCHHGCCDGSLFYGPDPDSILCARNALFCLSRTD